MNKLLLIGNGFDLAHGLKTSYNDFLLWYYKQLWEEYRNTKKLDNQLYKSYGSPSLMTLPSIEKIEDFSEFLKLNSMEDACKSELKNEVEKMYYDRKWVNIEWVYYQILLKYANKLQREGPLVRTSVLNNVSKLNNDLHYMALKLSEYLKTESKRKVQKKNDLAFHLGKIAAGNQGDSVMCINFNYTSTIFSYARELNISAMNNEYVVNIHGKLEDESNPIIFGYGDEMDQYYQQLENMNENIFLDHVKSFWYFKTENYRKIMRFCDSEDFKVYILGHSCGLSDRVLLNQLFEHDKCQRIQIFYYQRSDGSNDFFEKTQEISRHFKPQKKADMRKKIVSFENSKPLS
jgi:hypothetical protein